MKKNCAHCGKEFEAQRSNAIYCKRGCSTMACNKRRGFKTVRIQIEEKGKHLAVEIPPQLSSPGMDGIANGRAKDDITFAGAAESFIGASISNLVSHQLTKGEYDDRLAYLQQTLNQVRHEIKILNRNKQQPSQDNKVMGIPTQDLQKSGMPLIKWPTDPMV